MFEDKNKKILEKFSPEKKTMAMERHNSKAATVVDNPISVTKTYKDKNQKKLESLKDEIKKNINKLEEIEKESKD